ncbi:hypothetical protein O988_02067 [Pseudogymnoascus sp. VKM F-3808]|nr:hypothetical protein O988_02067 [Pseudogymnoascus sp. VKM F-3808]
MEDHSSLIQRAANAYNSRLAERRRPGSHSMYDQDFRRYANAEQQQMLFNMEFLPLDTGFNNASSNANPLAVPLSLMETREAVPVGNAQDQLYTPFQEASQLPQLRSSPWMEPSPDVGNGADVREQEMPEEMARLKNMVESLETSILGLKKQVESHDTTILGLRRQVETDSRHRAELKQYAEDLAKWTEKVQKHCDDAVKECRAMMKK